MERGAWGLGVGREDGCELGVMVWMEVRCGVVWCGVVWCGVVWWWWWVCWVGEQSEVLWHCVVTGGQRLSVCLRVGSDRWAWLWLGSKSGAWRGAAVSEASDPPRPAQSRQSRLSGACASGLAVIIELGQARRARRARQQGRKAARQQDRWALSARADEQMAAARQGIVG